jgi:alpha-tubulin suppressor-like RCC1 family protein
MTTLYGFGSNGGGQLGLGHLEDSNTPQPCSGLPDDECIKKVVGGGNHSAVLTTSGRLFLAGSSQLGSRQQKQWEKNGGSTRYDWTVYNEPYPQHTWQDVACGWAFTILVNDSGNVFGVGSSAFGELGVVSKQDVTELCAIGPDCLVDISSVVCGWRHCLALTRTGTVYGWGWGKHGQLSGQRHQDSVIFSPFMLDVPEPMAQLACGHLHSLFLGVRTGRVYGCGGNKNGQVGSRLGVANITTPTLCIDDGSTLAGDGDRAMAAWQLTTGWHHTALLSDDGGLAMWGKNDHGQLQDGLQHVTKVVCGSEHVLAQLDTGKVVAWGWNEHGNCTTDDDKVLAPVAVLPPAQHTDNITLIGAGCATSWIGLSTK